jgi:hypothetical protein
MNNGCFNPNVERVKGRWAPEDVQSFSELVCDVQGDFAEIGVAQGKTFKSVVGWSLGQNRMAHAIDSFRGMAEPREEDGPDCMFTKGMYDMGGSGGFRKRMRNRGVKDNQYLTWEGFIPVVFGLIPESVRLAFVIVDVDQYLPSKHAMDWAWERLNPGGIMAMDDIYLNCDYMASKAAKEFMRDHSDYHIVGLENFQLILMKEKT